MNDPVEDSVSEGRIGYGGVPVRYGELGDEDSGGVSESSVNEVQNFIGMDLRQGLPEPLIDNEDFDLCQPPVVAMGASVVANSQKL